MLFGLGGERRLELQHLLPAPWEALMLGPVQHKAWPSFLLGSCCQPGLASNLLTAGHSRGAGGGHFLVCKPSDLVLLGSPRGTMRSHVCMGKGNCREVKG